MQLVTTICKGPKGRTSIYRIYFDSETLTYQLEIVGVYWPKVGLWEYSSIDQALADVENRELCLRIGYGA